MTFPELTTETKKGAKGRSFTVHLVAAAKAPGFLPAASNGTERPALLAYAGPPTTVKAFSANLRSGASATTPGHRIELLRSLSYRYLTSTPRPGEALVVAYLPDLLHLQPSADSQGELRFLSAPPERWLDEQEALLEPELGADARDYARAAAFVARLDSRTPLPIANDPRFHLQLYRQALETQPWCDLSDARSNFFSSHGFKHLGLDTPVFCDAASSDFADFLAKVTREHLPRHPVVLPRPLPTVAAASRQLVLF